MLTQLEVFTPGISTPPFPITDGSPETDPVQIRNIDGLAPVKAVVNTNQYASIDGEFYNGSYVGKRNIVLTIGLNPDWATQTFEELRNILYKYFMPKNEVQLKFVSTHMPDVEISGYVESCEPTIFSKDPEMQVSIICPQSPFRATTLAAISGTTLAFTDTTTTTIDYQGSIPTGILVEVTAIDGEPAFDGEIRIINKTQNTDIFTVIGQVDDTGFVQVNTNQGTKYAKRIVLPSGLETNLLGKVSDGSVWISLEKGINEIQVLSETPGQAWSLQYVALYGGL